MYSKIFTYYICECMACEGLTGLVGYHENHCNCTDFYNLIMSDIAHYFYLRQHLNIFSNGEKLVADFCSNKAIQIWLIFLYSTKQNLWNCFFWFSLQRFLYNIIKTNIYIYVCNNNGSIISLERLSDHPCRGYLGYPSHSFFAK